MENKDDLQPDHIEEYCRQLGLQLRDEHESLINLSSVDSQMSLLGDAVAGDNSGDFFTEQTLCAETSNTSFECTKCEKIFTNSRQFLKHKCVSPTQESFLARTKGKGKQRGRKPKNKRTVALNPNGRPVDEENLVSLKDKCLNNIEDCNHLSDHTYVKESENSQFERLDENALETVLQCESCQLLTQIDPETGNIPCKKCEELAVKASKISTVADKYACENSNKKRRQYNFKTTKKDCPHCLKGFHSDKRLEKHLSLCKKNLVCSICNKDFNNHGQHAYSEYQVHYYTHFETKPFTCNVCSKGFIYKRDLQRHQLIHTENYIPKYCPECGAVFATDDKLMKHQLMHKKVSLSCDKCGVKFAKQSTLNKHMSTCQIRKSCEICGKVFNCLSKNLKNRYQEHMYIHSGEKPFKCQFCDRGFRDRSTRRKHERTHTGEKPYSCTICNRAFSQLRLLRNHIRTHTGEKPYSCQLCPLSFAKSCNLKYHMRVHTKEKPYTCFVCGKSFTQSGTYHKHMRRHTNECKTAATMIEIDVEKNKTAGEVYTPENSHIKSGEGGNSSNVTYNEDLACKSVFVNESNEPHHIINDVINNEHVSTHHTSSSLPNISTIENEQLTLIVSECDGSTLTTIDVDNISNMLASCS